MTVITLITGSLKSLEFAWFAQRVVSHIDSYVIPQYGDHPDQMIEDYSIHDIKKQLERYVARIDVGSRGHEEAVRDTLKIAHYSNYLLKKLREMEGDGDTES